MKLLLSKRLLGRFLFKLVCQGMLLGELGWDDDSYTQNPRSFDPKYLYEPVHHTSFSEARSFSYAVHYQQ